MNSPHFEIIRQHEHIRDPSPKILENPLLKRLWFLGRGIGGLSFD